MISIIIVHYHVKKELFACLTSIYSSKPKSPFEVIVVDNDEKKMIKKELKKLFPKARYITNNNKGFGHANNVGAKYAKGEYLFFLNPDTFFLNNALDVLVSFFKKHKDAAIAAPLLFDKNNIPYPLQGIKQLTPRRAIFALSFIRKLFPRNNIYQDYYLQGWNKKTIQSVDVVPGTAFMIQKEIFEKLGGFDDNFFLYFEEFDLCKRIKDQGYKIFMAPQAKIFHQWGASTQKRSDINTIFARSRFYYFKKHFGLFNALWIESALRINKYNVFLLTLLVVAIFLRLIHIRESMIFIGDQGWFYLSARDMLLTGNIPLVGIASSHPWLHQGAFWTYLLAPILLLFHFNPISGAYLSVVIGLVAIYAIYRLGSDIFSPTVGIIAAAMFATSPLIVASDRMPYHTSPIPLFTILFLYCIFRWIRGNITYFPLLILSIAILYNFELATSLLSVVFSVIFIFGLVTKKSWARKLFDLQLIVLSLIAFVIPMFPMFIYDVSHGFPQTIKLLVWVGYRALVFFGYPEVHPTMPVSFGQMATFIAGNMKQLVFSANFIVAFFLFIAGLSLTIIKAFREKIKREYSILSFIALSLIVGVLVIKTPSEAYFPMLFPSIILLVSILFGSLLESRNKSVKVISLSGLLCLLFVNSYSILQTTNLDTSYAQRLSTATAIVKEASGKEYTIKGAGPGSKFVSFTMNYEYLAWWIGHGPSKTDQPLKFVIEEKPSGIFVTKEEKGSL